MLTGSAGTFTSTTNAFGFFNFNNIPPGTYTLAEASNPLWVPCIPSGGSTTVNIIAGSVLTVDFLNKKSPCVAMALNFNTGVNNANALLPTGAFEPHWELLGMR